MQRVQYPQFLLVHSYRAVTQSHPVSKDVGAEHDRETQRVSVLRPRTREKLPTAAQKKRQPQIPRPALTGECDGERKRSNVHRAGAHERLPTEAYEKRRLPKTALTGHPTT
jgi:hypothetical protein